MIIGTEGSFKILSGFETPSDAYKDSVRFLKHVDGSITVVNNGARVEKTAKITIVNMTLAEQISLVDYLTTNIGKKINIQRENDTEYIFTPAWTASSYYCRVLSAESIKEVEYTPNGETHELTLSLSLSGVNVGDELNVADSSLIDVLVQVDTTNATYKQTGTPTTTGVENGTRWLKTDTNVVYEFNGTDWTTELFDIAPDDSDYGLLNGTFYWSAFASRTQDIPNGISEAHISGVLNARSMKFPKSSIDIRKGPNVSHKNGIQFGVRNTERFHKYITDNGINILGSKITMYSFYDTGSTIYVKKEFTGKNSTNNFGYANFAFSAEPFSLNDKSKHPSNVIADEVINGSDSRYVGIEPDMIGKTPYSTYGEWDMASLQDISKEVRTLSFLRRDPDVPVDTVGSDESSYLIGQITTAGLDPLKSIGVEVFSGDNSKFKFEISDEDYAEILATPSDFYIKILSDTHSPEKENENQLRELSNIEVNASQYTIHFETELPVSPDPSDEISFQILKTNYQHQSNEDESGGLGETVDGGFVEKNELYTVDNDKLIPLPSANFVYSGTDKNLIKLRLDDVDGESTVIKEIEKTPKIFGQIIEPIQNNSETIVFEDSSGDILPDSAFYEQEHEKSKGNIADWNSFYIPDTRYPMNYVAKYNYPVPMPILMNELSYNFEGIKKRFYYSANNWVSTFPMKENNIITAFQFPISHDTNLLNSLVDKNIYLTIGLKVGWFSQTGIDKTTGVSEYDYLNPEGFRVVVRFRNKSGSYVTNSDWEKEITAKQQKPFTGDMDIRNFKASTVYIDNSPESGGLINNPPTLSDSYDYVINDIALNPTNRDLIVDLCEGHTVWLTNYNGSGNARVDRYISGVWVEDVETLANEDKVFYAPRIQDGSESIVYQVSTTGSFDYNLNVLYDSTNPQNDVKLQGKELFNVSEFFSGTVTWGDLEAMEILLINDDYTNFYNSFDGGYSDFDSINQAYKRKRLVNEIDLISAPAIYTADDFSVVNRDLFAPLRGKTLNGVFPTPAKDIIENIMNVLYPDRWDSSSLDTLMGLSGRENWVFRKQFYEAKPTEEVLREILLNLWAVAIIDVDDKISFKSLNPDDYPLGSPVKEYTETEIIHDSIKQPKQRDLSELQQSFRLKFNYYPPSKLSESFQKFQATHFIDESGGSDSGFDIRNSRIIADQVNEWKREFMYHYSGDTLPMSEWIIKWFVFNSWVLPFRIPIYEFLGADPLVKFDYISVTDYFHTGGDPIEGFVVGLEPNFYDGYVEVKLYCPKPPNYRGAICDPFNDALFMPAREDLAGWNEGNGKINSAPDFGGDRITGVTDKDAGDFPRTISC